MGEGKATLGNLFPSRSLIVSRKKSAGDFKRFFLRGLAALLPTLLTVAILVYIFSLVRHYVGKYIDRGMHWVIAGTGLGRILSISAWDTYFSWWVHFVIVVFVVYLFGRFVASFVGRGVWRMVEAVLVRLPLIKQIYPSVKQVTDFLFAGPKLRFSRVVAVEYPRKGVWCLGLVTGAGLRTISEAVGSNMVTIFIPSSPTPMTGYTITVRRDEIVDLSLTIDEALRFVISGGVITPPAQLTGGTEGVSEPKSLPSPAELLDQGKEISE